MAWERFRKSYSGYSKTPLITIYKNKRIGFNKAASLLIKGKFATFFIDESSLKIGFSFSEEEGADSYKMMQHNIRSFMVNGSNFIDFYKLDCLLGQKFPLHQTEAENFFYVDTREPNNAR